MPAGRFVGNVWTEPAPPQRIEKSDGPAEPLRRPACAAGTATGGGGGSGGPLLPFTSHADIMAAVPRGDAP